jgi:phosphotransferase system HPr (HPr) family protein
VEALMSETITLNRTVTVVNENGLHMIPCSLMVRLVKDFHGEVRISNGQHEADARSMFDLLQLAAAPGTTLAVTVTGNDAEVMADQISRFFENGFKLET